MKVIQKPLDEVERKDALGNKYILFLHNDDINTFEFVIETLVDVCKHNEHQAEQCAIITHYKGKCDIKHGQVIELEPIMEELHRRGLSASINPN